MKKTILLIAGIFIGFASFAQTNFKWEKIDSVAKTKSQLYSDTKMFIAETWKSSKDVIQNDDKEGGVLLIRGISIRTATYGKGMFMQTVNGYTSGFLTI